MSNASSEPPQQPTESQVPWNPWWGLLFAAIVFYASQIVSALVISLYPIYKHWSNARAVDWSDNSISVQFLFILMAEGLMIGAIYAFLRGYKLSFKAIGLRRPRWSDLAYGLAAVPFYFLFYVLTVAAVQHFVPSLNIDQQQQLGFDHVSGAVPLIMTFISLVVLPPLAEEIMVRGFLYSTLKKALPLGAAVVTTSALFAAAHLPEGGASGPLYIAAIDTFILSLVLIYLREKTNGLWASITLHAIKNGIAFVALFVLNIH